MFYLSRRSLLKSIDREAVVRAIRTAEQRTSGEMRVSVAPFFWGSVRKVAEKAFVRLGMTRTQERNAVLFFIVPGRRRFAVLGDEGIHAVVGEDFWKSLASVLSESFKKGEFSQGLIRAIGMAGEKMAGHFPYDAASDVNELQDEVDFSSK